MKRNDIIKLKDHSQLDDEIKTALTLNAMMGEDRTTMQYLGCVTMLQAVVEENGEECFVPKGMHTIMPLDLFEKELDAFEHKGIGIGDFVLLKEGVTNKDMRAPDDPPADALEKIEKIKRFLLESYNQVVAIDVNDNAVRLHPIDLWVELDAVEVISPEEIEETIEVDNLKIGQKVVISEIADEIMVRHGSSTNDRMEKYFGTEDTIIGIYPIQDENWNANYSDVMVELENAEGLYLPQALER